VRAPARSCRGPREERREARHALDQSRFVGREAPTHEAFALRAEGSPGSEPEARLAYEQRVTRCGIYPREIDHRKKTRKSYRTTEV